MAAVKHVIYAVCVCSFLCFIYTCNAGRIFSIYPMDSLSQVLPGGGLRTPVRKSVLYRLIGQNITSLNALFFTTSNCCCTFVRSTDTFPLLNLTYDKSNAVVEVEFDTFRSMSEFWYMCLILNYGPSLQIESYDTKHQGSHDWLRIRLFVENDTFVLPLYVHLVAICILLVLSGLFSGLNLGLMSLDQTELQLIEKVGSPNEKGYARRIGPLRKRGNLLLCSLLLGNVLVNSTFTILFDQLTNGFIAIVCSTVGIVIFGEILPQAICSRHGLAVGAKTYWITIIFIILTFPAAFPISLCLDLILGKEIGQVFNKEKLQELIRMNADNRVLHDNEANIISGALQLTNKSVEDVMTAIEDVYMLEINNMLDFETITEIMHQGYTRIPVYDGEKTNIVSLLNTKELALIDPDDRTLLSTVCKFYDHRPLFVDHDVKLDVMLQTFLQPGSSHMAIVQVLHNTDNKDPHFENLGVITLEDVIEEILQSEIVDETDIKSDNRNKGQPPLRQKEDYELLIPEARKSVLPKHLAFAAFQFLTTTVEPFSDVHMARSVLKTLMRKDIVMSLSPTEPVSKKNYIFQKGVPTDRFVLILQGTVEVEIGDESMVFETGPFSHFGVQCINSLRIGNATNQNYKNKDYVPDFSVRALSEIKYLCITRNMYIAALHTSRMLRYRGNITVADAFDAEYEKVKHNENHSSCDNIIDSYIPCSIALKNGESAKERSTSSLDRPIFFHRKQDPCEELYKKKQIGFSAGDKFPESKDKMNALETEYFWNFELETASFGSDGFTHITPKPDHMMSSPSLSTHTMHNNF